MGIEIALTSQYNACTAFEMMLGAMNVQQIHSMCCGHSARLGWGLLPLWVRKDMLAQWYRRV